MTRYFFHIRNGAAFVKDEEGIELPGIEAARKEAIEAAREILADRVRKGVPLDGEKFIVANADHKIVAVIPFMEAIVF
jgi:hypothetical protein